MVAGLPALSIDFSAPSLAVLPDALDTTVFVAGLSLSMFVLGFGVGQFAGGRASDQIGRRPTLLAGLALYVLAGLCCSIAATGGQLASARLLQGAAAGACSIQAFAMVQDLFEGETARRKQAYVSIVLAIMPMLAPALGVLVILVAGWRTVHLLMAAGGLLLAAIVTLFVSESLPAQERDILHGLGFSDAVGLLRDRGFRSIAVVNALSYAAIFAYIAGAPIVMIVQYKYTTSAYAVLFACTAAALSAGAIVNARLARRLDCRTLVWPALLIQAAANVGLIIGASTPPTYAAWIMLPLLVIGCFMRGIVSPNLVHAALSVHRGQAGLAAALVGVMQLGTAAAASALLARLLDQFGALSVALTMATLSTAATLLWTITKMGPLVAERR